MQILEQQLPTDHGAVLTAYLQPVGGEFAPLARRPAVLVLPGGGYQMCSDREADPVALAYLQAGFQAFVLRYATGVQAAWPNPLEDYEAAAALIRSHAGDWALYPDKLAVIGFSAGGHLAACAAAMAGQRPNAAILGYPVIDKDTVEAYLPGAPDAAKAVDEHTCPCFVFAGRDDTTVPVANTLAWLEALTRYDISYECHIYSQAGHGFSTGESFLGAQGAVQPRTALGGGQHRLAAGCVRRFFRRRPRCAALPGPGQRQPRKRLQRGLHARLPAAKPGHGGHPAGFAAVACAFASGRAARIPQRTAVPPTGGYDCPAARTTGSD